MEYSSISFTDATYPHTLKVPETISDNSKKIAQKGTLLIRLIESHQEAGISLERYEKAAYRIAKRLDLELDLWEIYKRRDEEEYYQVKEDLENNISRRKMLKIERNLGEITVEELSLKLRTIDWNIENLREKEIRLEYSLQAINSIRGLFAPVDIDSLYLITKEDHTFLREIKMTPDVTRYLSYIFSRIRKTIEQRTPTTI